MDKTSYALVLVGGWSRSQWPGLLAAAALVGVQVGLGLMTLRLGLSQPLITVAHQAVAALLVAVLSALAVRGPSRERRVGHDLSDSVVLEVCHG